MTIRIFEDCSAEVTVESTERKLLIKRGEIAIENEAVLKAHFTYVDSISACHGFQEIINNNICTGRNVTLTTWRKLDSDETERRLLSPKCCSTVESGRRSDCCTTCANQRRYMQSGKIKVEKTTKSESKFSSNTKGQSITIYIEFLVMKGCIWETTSTELE